MAKSAWRCSAKASVQQRAQPPITPRRGHGCAADPGLLTALYCTLFTVKASLRSNLTSPSQHLKAYSCSANAWVG